MPQSVLQGRFPCEKFFMDFAERLTKVFDALGITQRQFFLKCGLSNRSANSFGAQGATTSVLQKICETFPQVSLDYLVLGKGSVLRVEDAPTPTFTPIENNIHHNATVNINYGALKDAIVEAIKESKL